MPKTMNKVAKRLLKAQLRLAKLQARATQPTEAQRALDGARAVGGGVSVRNDNANTTPRSLGQSAGATPTGVLVTPGAVTRAKLLPAFKVQDLAPTDQGSRAVPTRRQAYPPFRIA